jgi:iron complex outermembrane receptor protein
MAKFRSSAVGLSLIMAMAFPAMARAQESAATPAAAAEPGDDGPIADVVVTAERREQSLQRSSLSIQVLGRDEVQRSNLTQASDLNMLVPGLQIGTGGNAPQIYIRGVGDFAASALSNPAVAVNIDGVYVARPQAVNSLFFDLARIEVLKGPQGTLYGRNSSGGNINLVTNVPVLNRFEGYLQATVGNYDLRRVEGAVNLPIGTNAAIRVAGNFVDRDGYLSDGTDDDQRQAVRLRLLWKPTSNVSLMLNADYAHEGGSGPGYVMLPRPPGDGRWTSATSPAANIQLVSQPPIGFLVPFTQPDSFRNNTFWNFSAELNVDMGWATLTVLPAYRDVRLRERNYPAGLRNFIPEATAQQTSAEVRLAHESDRFDWVIGAYYFDEDQKAEQQIYQGILQDNIGFYTPSTRSYAGFGQATFHVNDALRLIGGLRYTYERRALAGQIFTKSPNGLPPGTPLPALLESFGGRDSFDSFTWRAGVEFDVAPRSMLFATASTGFKAGGFNQTVAPEDSYDPETITAFQFGSRNTFLDGHLQLNFEAFYWRLEDAQIAHVKFDPVGNVNLITDNAGSSRIYGANVELLAALSDADTLRLFVEYNHAEYRQFNFDTAYSIFGNPLFNPLSTGCPVGTPFNGPTFGSVLINVDCSGFQMPRSPRWSGAAMFSHRFELGGGHKLLAAVTGQFASARWLGFEYVPTQRSGSYATLDADLTWTSPGGRWTIAGFVHNVTKEAVYTGGGVQAFAPPLVYATIAPPRTFGLRVRVNFGR